MSDGRLTVGEERLKQLFAEFKLDLLTELAKKATLEAHELLAHRVTQLELWQAAQVATESTKRQFSARQLAVAGLAIAVLVGLFETSAALIAAYVL